MSNSNCFGDDKTHKISKNIITSRTGIFVLKVHDFTTLPLGQFRTHGHKLDFIWKNNISSFVWRIARWGVTPLRWPKTQQSAWNSEINNALPVGNYGTVELGTCGLLYYMQTHMANILIYGTNRCDYYKSFRIAKDRDKTPNVTIENNGISHISVYHRLNIAATFKPSIPLSNAQNTR